MEKLKTHRKALFLLLIAATSLTCHAQSNCFTYDYEDANVIIGLTDDGEDVKGIMHTSISVLKYYKSVLL